MLWLFLGNLDALALQVSNEPLHGVSRKDVLHEAGLLVGDLGLHAEVMLQEGAQRPVGAPDHLGIGLALLGEDHLP